MALDLDKLRRLVALDPADPLSRFALGKKLLDEGTEHLPEAIEHLTIANQTAPAHLATYPALATAFIQSGRLEEARSVLTAGLPRVQAVGEGMGRDLGPLMAGMLADLDRR